MSMTYKLNIHPDAAAEVAALPKRAQRQVDRKIMGLAKNPKPAKARLLKDKAYKGIWKLRSGDYRILYEIQAKALVVFVVMVGDRKSVYDKLKRALSQP